MNDPKPNRAGYITAGTLPLVGIVGLFITINVPVLTAVKNGEIAVTWGYVGIIGSALIALGLATLCLIQSNR